MSDNQIYFAFGFFLSGFIGSAIGAIKGNAGTGLLLGMLLGPLGWLLIFILGASSGKACPSCGERIRPEAVVCKHCRRDVPGAVSSRKGPFVT